MLADSDLSYEAGLIKRLFIRIYIGKKNTRVFFLIPDRNPALQPSIVEMTEKAIELLSTNPKGFFLLVEGKLRIKKVKKLLKILTVESSVNSLLNQYLFN